MKIDYVLGLVGLGVVSTVGVLAYSALFTPAAFKLAVEKANEENNNAAVINNLRACVTANTPKEEIYEGYVLQFIPGSQGARFTVDHAWSNLQATTSEQIRQRNAQERRCNKAAFGRALANG